MDILPLMFHFCDAIWEYRVGTNEVFFHHDAMDPECCGYWMSYNAVDSLYRKTYIYPLDLDIWQKYLCPDALRDFCCGPEEEEHFYIRMNNTRKGREWHEVYLRKQGKDRLFLASRDTREMQRTAAISRAVIPEFDYVCRINVTDGSYVLYYSDEDKTIVPQSASDDYEKILTEYNRQYVVSEDLTKQMRLDKVRKELADQDEYILYATMQDKGSLSYKKLRFCYEDESRERILLTRTDIGALIGERKLREREQAKRIAYLENMPVAFCSIRVLLNDKGQPHDFQFTYCNRAHEELEGTKSGELIGKNFYEFFEEADPKWLQYYYETAYQGIPHVIRSFSPEIGKYLLIYTFCLEKGCCECVLQDVSEQQFLIQELKNSRETVERILGLTTDQVFQYLPERDSVILDGRDSGNVRRTMTMDALRRMLLEEELLNPDYREAFENGFRKIRDGEHSVSFIVQGGRYGKAAWKWFRVTMFDFQDGSTRDRKVFGFLQNIDEFRSREEALLKKAEQDSLTGVLNAGAGKQRIVRMLEARPENDRSYQAMFVMDLDDFKEINDTMGHMAGDRALTGFARILHRTFRAEDVVYRLGGDEFVVFVQNLHDSDQGIRAMLQRLMDHVEEARAVHPFLSCSIGVFVTRQKHSFEECYERADAALYEAKRRGKGAFCIETDRADCTENTETIQERF